MFLTSFSLFACNVVRGETQEMVWHNASDSSSVTLWKVGDAFQINTYTTDYQSYSHSAAMSSIGYVVVWDTANQFGSFNSVMGQLYGTLGVAVGKTEFIVANDTRYV